jgi:hypothetical protein
MRKLLLGIALLASCGVSLAQQQQVELTKTIAYGSSVHEVAVDKIVATNVVEAKASVHYEAGKSVVLKPGFMAEKGTTFKATIGKVERISDYNESLGTNLSARPNPFVESTEIVYVLPQAGKVSLSVANSLGMPVALLVNDEYQEAGVYRVKFEGQQISVGSYIYTLKTDRSVLSKKLIKL